MMVDSLKAAFQNPSLLGIFITAFLVFFAPIFANTLAKRKSPSMFLILYILLLSIGVLVMWVLKSRTSLIMCMSVACLIVIAKKKLQRSQILLLLIIVGLAFATLFRYKFDSSYGRLLILKVTFSQVSFNEVSWFYGVDRFEQWYNLAQARYFSTGDLSGKDALIADNTYFAFNDLLQLVIEKGIVAGLVILLCMYWYLRSVFLYVRNTAINPYVLGAHLSIISLLVSSFFYYPFQVPITYFMLIASALVVLVMKSNMHRSLLSTHAKSFILIAFPFGITYSGFSLFRIIHYSLEKEAANTLCKSGFLLEAEIAYRKLLRYEMSDGKLLFDYSENLYCLNKLDSALFFLNQSATFFYNDRISVLKAQIYDTKNDWKQAEMFFKEAVYMNPKSFGNRLMLINFYFERNASASAIFWARETLRLPEKIPSESSAAIKLRIQQLLTKLN